MKRSLSICLPIVVLVLLLLLSIRFSDNFTSPENAYVAQAALIIPSIFAVRAVKRHDLTIGWALVLLGLANLLSIAIFAAAYDGCRCLNAEVDYVDALYFSIVTWTTLGYGDFQPTGAFKLFAAIEAVYGYVFLGLLVGLIGNYFAEARTP